MAYRPSPRAGATRRSPRQPVESSPLSPLLRTGRSFKHRNTLEQTAALQIMFQVPGHLVELRGSHSERMSVRSGSQWLSHANVWSPRRARSEFGDVPHLVEVLLQVRDRRKHDPVGLTERDQLRDTSHRAILVTDLRQHTGRLAARERAKVERGLGVAVALAAAARLAAQREHVPRPTEGLSTH